MPSSLATEPLYAGPTAIASAQQSDLNHGYARRYRVHAGGGECQLQHVRVDIRYLVDHQPLLEFRQSYYEFFQFRGAAPEPIVDVHDFDVVRDGWRQTIIAGLLRRHRVRRAPAGEPRLRARKRFVIGRGQTAGTRPHRIGRGAYFGILRSGPQGDSRATLRIARGDGTWHTISNLPPGPTDYCVAGEGAFTSAIGHRTIETLDYRFSRLSGRFIGRESYQPHRIETHR